VSALRKQLLAGEPLTAPIIDAHCHLLVRSARDVLLPQSEPARVVFGSGLPWAPPGPALASILYADISAGEQALICGRQLAQIAV
jgi:hypothetical protein